MIVGRLDRGYDVGDGLDRMGVLGVSMLNSWLLPLFFISHTMVS